MTVIIQPLATEKSTRLIDSTNTIVLIVDKKATKPQIKSEVEKTFGVKVEKVNVVITPTGEKKAYVKLKPEFKATDVAHKLGIL
ncbi:MAG: 50S ribosomal protein L23 [Candidatus Aramenus sulfurataquae]|jgi:large subunit ribosomal protein L23|uniref:Large ribosomal subunit protein uL23 n=2 Tax=Candidatus Aramenus sulfurataquae TaxID=1326980 RepID=W7KVM2_9CREN|nr:MAG: 50S ribosomal protein L23 [Candidatus Aramenus sulfurataquae]MBW9140589.1 50S ribosomal protein L23 [Candidatus Aramenus sp.]MCL7343314.1 50S ribosomal protein L23 [Candidatus Aramenus sulfurataquae]